MRPCWARGGGPEPIWWPPLETATPRSLSFETTFLIPRKQQTNFGFFGVVRVCQRNANFREFFTEIHHRRFWCLFRGSLSSTFPSSFYNFAASSCLCNCNTLTFLWANTIKPLMSYNSWSPIVPHHHHLLHPEITGKLPRQSTKIKLGR
jgi:hypothetical protein